MCDDYEEDPYDYCYECGGYGDDYYMDEDGKGLKKKLLIII